MIFWVKEEARNIGDKMVNSRVKIVFLLVLLGYLLSACAQLKEAGRTIGHLLGMLREKLVMGLVTRPNPLVRE